jgi:hypothetical protein
MSAEIVPFAWAAGSGQKRPDNPRSAAEAEARSFVQILREDLHPSNETKLRRKLQRKLQTDEDAVLLAQRLGTDLERVKRLGRGKLSEVLENAGQRPTNRARFALFDGEVPACGKRIHKLQPYIGLSDAIARALSKDEDLFLYEKLEDLNLIELDHDADEEARRLGLLLERMAKAVSDRTGLLEFFELAARTPGAMHPWGDIHSYAMVDYSNFFSPTFQGEGSPPTSMTVLRDRRHEGGFDHWTEPQPLPSVPICRILEQTVHGQARIARWVKPTPANLEKLSREIDAMPEADMVPVTVELWREFGLCLGERHQRGQIGPMFSAKAHVKVHVKDVVATPFHPWTLERLLQAESVILVDGDRWTICRAKLDFEEGYSNIWVEPAPSPGAPNYAVEHYYFSQHAFDAWNIRRILDRSEYGETRAEFLLDEVPNEQRPKLYRFSGDIGRRFEAALASGALEGALQADVERLKAELHRYLTDRRGKLAAQDEEIAGRWQPTNLPDNEVPKGN